MLDEQGLSSSLSVQQKAEFRPVPLQEEGSAYAFAHDLLWQDLLVNRESHLCHARTQQERIEP